MSQLPIVSPTSIAEVLRKANDQTTRELKSVSRGNSPFSKRDSFGSPQDFNSETHLQLEFNQAMKILGKTESLPGVLASVDHRAASLLQTYIVQQGIEEEKIIEIESKTLKARAVQFDEKDWTGWAKSFFSWWRGIVPHPWIETPSNKKINNTARIAILGDWGTGSYGAPVCAKSIESSKDSYNALIHLGDVYYSGDTKEVKERFLDLWIDPAKTNWENKVSVIHRACNSNHEMYTGGHAYFNYTLAKFEQSASYFALHNDHWILVGLDTGYKEGDLMDGQVEWLTKLVSEANGRKVILFSHHQPFSWFDKGYRKITDKLDNLLRTNKIFAWYWGHEHRCILYDKHPVYGLYGRCVGHSGYPYFRDKFIGFKSELTNLSSDKTLSWKYMPKKENSPSAQILDGPNEYIEGYKDNYGANGYMTLDFSDDELIETVNSANGEILYNREIK